MRFLLDTCSLLWFAQDSARTSVVALAAIENPEHDTAVSTVSFWELSMKSVVGKLTLELSPSEIEALAIENGIAIIPLTVSHVERFHQLPVVHRDAFDRLLAAIALAEGHTLITPDPAFDALGVVRLW
jgi:PIN domain nuclease of toxin-antitoxin system